MRWTKWMHAVLSISIQLSQRLRRGFQIMFEFSWHRNIRSREFVVNEWSGRMPRVWMRGDQKLCSVQWDDLFQWNFQLSKKCVLIFGIDFLMPFFFYRSKSHIFGGFSDISSYCHNIGQSFHGKGATHPKYHSDAQQEDGLRFGVSRLCSKGKKYWIMNMIWTWCFFVGGDWHLWFFLSHEWMPPF